jgi:hypothetical protein
VLGSGFFFGQTVLRTWNEHEEINETSFSFEFFWQTGCARSLVFPPEPMKKWVVSLGFAATVLGCDAWYLVSFWI